MAESTEIKSSLKSQSAWLLLAKVIGFVFSFLLPLLVVRFLTQEKVGVYQQVFQVIGNAVSILSLGFSMSAFYFLSREKELRNASVFNILLFNSVMGGIAFLMLFFFPQLLGNLFQNDELTQFAPKIGVVIWLWIFSSFLETVAIANREAKLATVFIIVAQFSKMALMVSAVILFATVESFIYAAMIQAVIQIIVLLIYLNSRFPRFWTAFDFKFFREQLVYALPFGFAGLLWTLQTDIHKYFVGHRFSAAEYAVYAYGCFQLPLIAMLHESVTSVLISRMSELQSRSEKSEMIRLTARAIQKLSFFYFPTYFFFLITAQVFITTLFTNKFAASVPIFLINITLLPFDIWITDPIIRAYKELGRYLLILRIFIFAVLVTALYFGIQYFDLRGMIGISLAVILFERLIAVLMVMRKLGVKREDAGLLKGVLKTAVASLSAGTVLFVFYWFGKEFLYAVCLNLSASFFSLFNIEKPVNFVGGSLFLGICLMLFAAVYLLISNYLGLIDEEEKNIFGNQVGKLKMIFKREKIGNHQPEILN